MAGSRVLTQEEVTSILSNLKDLRDKALAIIALKTGYRISELLSLKVNQVVQYGRLVDTVTVERKSMKGKTRSRSVVLHQDAKRALEEMGVLTMSPNERIFPICSRQASRLLKEAVVKSEIQGKVSFHSCRKVFAKKMYDHFNGDIFKTQKALGHSSLSSTAYYLQFNQSDIDEAILNA